MLSLIWIDYAIIGLSIIVGIIGLVRGFAYEIFSLSMWCIALCLSLNFSHEWAVFLGSWLTHGLPRLDLAFFSLVLVTLAIGAILALLLGDSIRVGGWSLINRLLGMCVGAVRTGVVITLLILLAGMTSLPTEPWWGEAQLIGPFQILASWLRMHGSADLAELINYE